MAAPPEPMTCEQAEALALERYGLRVTATSLPSERDQNFLLQAGGAPALILKVANPNEDPAFLGAVQRAMEAVATHTALTPQVVPARDGQLVGTVAGPDGAGRLAWAISVVPGVPLGTVSHRPRQLWGDLGRAVAHLTRGLAGFDDPALHRDFPWQLATGRELVTRNRGLVSDTALGEAVDRLMTAFDRHTAGLLPRLRRSAVHNDLNDYNVLVGGGRDPFERYTRVTGLIDFGDMVHGPTVGDLAVAAAYPLLDAADPLGVLADIVRGCHAEWALAEDEMAALWGLAMLRLCLSAVMAAEQQARDPANTYLGISQAPIRRTLPRLAGIPFGLAVATVRGACGFEPAPGAKVVRAFLQHGAAAFAPVLGVDLRTVPAPVLDLSVGSPDAFASPPDVPIAIGRYDEPRLCYATPSFAGGDGTTDEARTIHLGLDLFAPAGTPVFAPLDGIVAAADVRALPLDYGGVVVLEHRTDSGTPFYTLHGHLSPDSIRGLTVGKRVAAGASIACLGTSEENGGWAPHLHLQVMTDLLDLGSAFPGVGTPSRRAEWRSLCPDPNLIVGVPADRFPPAPPTLAEAKARRRALVGASVRTSYRDPLRIVRGRMQHLFDDEGRRYLDAYNNVPHVGHCHPRVVEAAARQMAVLNTNTRYLHDGREDYAERLAATLPDPLEVCFLVSSASEANELAVRLARAYTGATDLLVLEAAYHGNTTTLIDISPYKHAGPGGHGAPDWVHVASLADDYRGKHRRGDPDAGARYAADLAAQVEAITASGRRLAGFIAESCPSVGGQVIFPSGYLAGAYAAVRSAGGLCIADEVQTGLGRIGSHFWAFEAQGVVPDIVVMGKPLGNGHPLAAVVTTRAIADSFDNGMEYFSTFGGNTVSCAVGAAVLDVMRDEGLQAHAARVGNHLLAGLRELAVRHPLVGDVRGSGLFLGVELVRDRQTLEPAAVEAEYVVNRLREERILLGTDGPLHNVLKIRPPMPFDETDAGRLLATLDRVLAELAG